MSTSIIAFAKLTPKAEFYESVKKTLLDIIPKALKKSGCNSLKLYEGKEEKCLYIYEAWENEAAHENHLQQDYTQRALENFVIWLAKPIEIIELTPVSA